MYIKWNTDINVTSPLKFDYHEDIIIVIFVSIAVHINIYSVDANSAVSTL
jgi:hypothetical protein